MLLKFFIYSVLGCGLENLWGIIRTGKRTSHRMLLNLPMCPVYGAGGVALSVFLSAFRDNVVLLCILGAFLSTSVELLFFSVGRLFFSVRLWDYTKKPYSLFGGICGEYSVWWGIASIIFVRYIDPFFGAVIGAASPYTELLLTSFLAVVTLADAAKTVSVLKSYKTGNIDKLPDCFWYMKRIS